MVVSLKYVSSFQHLPALSKDLHPELGIRSLFPGSLSSHFISIDRYRSSAHFANFQVRSSLNRSKKNQWFALEKER